MDASTCHPQLRNIWNSVCGVGSGVETARWWSGGMMMKVENGQDGGGKG